MPFVCFSLVAEMERMIFSTATGFISPGKEQKHRWINLGRSNSWIKTVVRLVVGGDEFSGVYPGCCLSEFPSCICQSLAARQQLRPGASLCFWVKGVTSDSPLARSPIHSQLEQYITQDGWQDHARVFLNKKEEIGKWTQSSHHEEIGKNTLSYLK